MSNLIGDAADTAVRLREINGLVEAERFNEARPLLEELALVIDGNPNSVVAGEYYYLAAVINYNSTPPTETLAFARRAYALVSATAENLIIGRIQALLGKTYVALGDLKSGEEFIRDSISSFRRIECDSELVGCYNKLAQVYFIKGEFKLAERYLQDALELLSKQEAAEVPLLKAKGNLARIKVLLGKWVEAARELESCVVLSQRLRIAASEARNLLSLGYVRYLEENYSGARELYQAAHAIIKRENLLREMAIYHEYMGDLLSARGEQTMARQHYNYALEIGERSAPESAIVSQCERRLAELEFQCHHYALAMEHTKRALEIGAQIGERVEVAAAKKVQGALAVIEGNEDFAVTLFDQAVSDLEATGELREQALAAFVAGKSLVKSERYRQLASRSLAMALKLAERLVIKRLQVDCYYQLAILESEAGNNDQSLSTLSKCEDMAKNLQDDLTLEQCRVFRMTVEEKLVESSLSAENPFALFHSLLDDAEYRHSKTGDLLENLQILKNRIGADRAFVVNVDQSHHTSEVLASLEFDQGILDKLSRLLGNGRRSSIPLDRPLLVTSLESDRRKAFEYLADSSSQIRALITVPLKISDSSTGILYIDRLTSNDRPFSQTDLYFAVAFADILAFKSSEEQKQRLCRDNQRLQSQLEQRLAFPNIITASQEILDIFERIIQVKDSPISILIEGETGTGKDLLAKAIHYNSNRKEKRFVSVNCAALPETLLESELFGYKRGAFTGADGEKIGLFEEANGGTFFLDEIGDMPLSIQVKLLRVIEEKEVVRLGETVPRKVDVRVISATNCDLRENMEHGQFRQDLYYRLSTFSFRLPPLRERREDIPLLVRYFIEKYDAAVMIEPDAFQFLTAYAWPGNVRELENEVKKMILLSGGGKTITKQLISRRILENSDGLLMPHPDGKEGFALYDYIARLERDYIMKALRKHNWVKKHAAGSLSIPESTLRLKMRQYLISRE